MVGPDRQGGEWSGDLAPPGAGSMTIYCVRVRVCVSQLALRAVNAAHSAYGCFLFSPLFFLHYSLDSVSQQDGDATIRCKLSMKVRNHPAPSPCWLFSEVH